MISTRVKLHLFLESIFDVINRIQDLNDVCISDDLKIIKNSFSPKEDLNVLKLLANEAMEIFCF